MPRPITNKILPYPYELQTRAAPKADGETLTFLYVIVDVRTGQVTPPLEPSYASPQAAVTDFTAKQDALTRTAAAPLEIDRMLTVSTAHISGHTAAALNDNGETDTLPVSVYRKAGFGWFVYYGGVPESQLDRLPEDLRTLVTYARANDCTVLCLDQDAVESPNLPTYAWDEPEAPTLD